MPTFANPLGLLALLGIPAVIAIHFLQRKAVQLPLSTLFLLDHTRREAVGGRRFERIIPSIPLWMQILALLLLTWFLAEPRYRKAGSVQRVAVVIDSSASMGVFKPQALLRLHDLLPEIQGSASEIQLTLLESAPNRPRLYTGTSISDIDSALENWHPHDGPVDPTRSLRLARSLVSREGSVIYLTDTPAIDPPFGATVVAVGEAIDNVGFTGVSFTTGQGSLVWRALVKNHSTRPADRTWSIHTKDGSTEPRPLHLEPGGIITLQSAFPLTSENVRIVLSPDRFPLDDVLPLVAPAPKPLSIFPATSPSLVALSEKLIRALEAAETSADSTKADLRITACPSHNPDPPAANSIAFVQEENRSAPWLKGAILAESHPMMEGLNWQSLSARDTTQITRKPGDTVLLWQDKRPLIFLRDQDGTRQLLFNFDPALSNAEQLPAFIVLLHRFAESVRQAKIAPVSENHETGQPIELTSAPDVPLSITATDPSGNALPPSSTSPQSAPPSPGFLSIRQGEQTLLNAAVHFGDPREADFSSCATTPAEDTTHTASIDNHTRPDPLWRLWLLILLAALLVSWKYSAAKPARLPDPAPPAP